MKQETNMKLVSNNAYTYYLFDHMFHYTWLIYKCNEFDLRGAIEGSQLTVAYLSAKNVLLWALKIYIYVHGETPNTMVCHILEQAHRLLDNDNLATQIRTLYYSCAHTDEDIKLEIARIQYICTHELISNDLWDYIGRDGELNFKNHVASAKKIDSLFKEIESVRYNRLAYPDEITQLIRDIGVEVTKGR